MLAGASTGIGAMVEKSGSRCILSYLSEFGPAGQCGQLGEGDRILSIGTGGSAEVDIIGMTAKEVVDLLRGENGSSVSLTVHPANATDPSTRKTVSLVRRPVEAGGIRPNGRIVRVQQAGGKIMNLGVITLKSFYGAIENESSETKGVSDDVEQVLKRLKLQAVQGLVFDLRGNGGGLLTEAIEVAGLFVGKRTVVQTKDYQGTVLRNEPESHDLCYGGPMVVLVDRVSASGTEIVAGALQTYGRAVVAGELTQGVGTVQTIVELKSVAQGLARATEKTGSAKITIQQFHLPNGQSTQLNGITPDILLPFADKLWKERESDRLHAVDAGAIPPIELHRELVPVILLESLRAKSGVRQRDLDELHLETEAATWLMSRRLRPAVLSLQLRRDQILEDADFLKNWEAARQRSMAKGFPSISVGFPSVSKQEGSLRATSTGVDSEGQITDVQLRESLRILADSVELGWRPAAVAKK
jgi:carboxyl-terminal processing protease